MHEKKFIFIIVQTHLHAHIQNQQHQQQQQPEQANAKGSRLTLEEEREGEPIRECLSVCESGGTRLYAWVVGKGAITGGSTLRSAMLNLEVISVSLFVRYSLVRCHCTCIQM